MTDNEIIKILENEADFDCGMCCNNGENCLGEECASFISRAALDLINRQKEKIERLQKTQYDIDNFARDLCKERVLKGKAIADFEDLQEYIRKEKSEAIREFAERLKEETGTIFCETGFEYNDTITAINTLVKEMAGDDNEHN